MKPQIKTKTYEGHNLFIVLLMSSFIMKQKNWRRGPILHAMLLLLSLSFATKP